MTGQTGSVCGQGSAAPPSPEDLFLTETSFSPNFGSRRQGSCTWYGMPLGVDVLLQNQTRTAVVYLKFLAPCCRRETIPFWGDSEDFAECLCGGKHRLRASILGVSWHKRAVRPDRLGDVLPLLEEWFSHWGVDALESSLALSTLPEVVRCLARASEADG